MLPLLLAALGAPGAAPFVLQVASWCSAATNATPGVEVTLSRMSLVCGDLRSHRAVRCPGAAGPLGALGDNVAKVLNADPRWGQRLRERQRVCQDLPGVVAAQRGRRRQLLIVPERSGPALSLVCHAWGFTPGDITLRWLRNGDVVDDVGDIIGDIIGDVIGDAEGRTRALPVGDGTFRAQVTVPLPPGTKDTFECLALHPSLEEPLGVTWGERLGQKTGIL
ncbi:HFE protein, partial [Bombycilla garrulus]|nr:HFE protein [Bombycilla garrulus]